MSTLSSVHGLRFAFAVWKSTLPGPGTTSFVTPYTRGPARERFAADIFERFGLPDGLTEIPSGVLRWVSLPLSATDESHP